jgi:hypothetical protein
MMGRRKGQAVAVTAPAPPGPAEETATTTATAADVILGFIVDVGHWGMAVIGLGLAFSIVAFVTRFDPATQGAMSAPEFIASLAFSSVVVTAGTFIHVIELRRGWVDPYELPPTASAAATANRHETPAVQKPVSGQLNRKRP